MAREMQRAEERGTGSRDFLNTLQKFTPKRRRLGDATQLAAEARGRSKRQRHIQRQKQRQKAEAKQAIESINRSKESKK